MMIITRGYHLNECSEQDVHTELES